jgi:hypothetical protein
VALTHSANPKSKKEVVHLKQIAPDFGKGNSILNSPIALLPRNKQSDTGHRVHSVIHADLKTENSFLNDSVPGESGISAARQTSASMEREITCAAGTPADRTLAPISLRAQTAEGCVHCRVGFGKRAMRSIGTISIRGNREVAGEYCVGWL